MASEELVNRLRERATTLWQWASRAERTTGPSATTEQWRIDRDLHDDAATEIYRLARELEATRAALRIAQTTAANLHDTIRLRDRELEEARERERRIIEVLERSACHDLMARDALDAVRRALATDTEANDGE